MKTINNMNNPRVLPAALFAMSILIGTWLLAGAYKNRNHHSDTITVTGLGSKDFTSDLIVWSGNFSRSGENLKEAYADLNADRDAIKNYLVSKGIKQEEIVFSAVGIENTYNSYTDSKGYTHSDFTGYSLSQSVTVQSKEIDKVENISREVTDLINQGIKFNSDLPNYFYTKLPQLKLQMIEAATKDAHERAEKIAENADGKLGKLKSADMGVFQITGQNSTEEYSWGGTFNTSSKLKTASITVTLNYESN